MVASLANLIALCNKGKLCNIRETIAVSLGSSLAVSRHNTLSPYFT
jgi:hypothetical protein